MTEKRITILEYHSHGAGPQALIDRFAPAEQEQQPPDEPDESADDGGINPLAIILALAVLIGIGLAIRYKRGGDELDFDPEQVEVTEFEE